MNDELAELKKISRILALVNAKAIETELLKYATTKDRKKVWVLINGQRGSREIAELIGITKRGVNKILKVFETATLIENLKKQPPKRLLDYVPPSWIKLVKVEELGEEQQEQHTE
jgi:DNA-binding MarR family transcriptional regulator